MDFFSPIVAQAASEPAAAVVDSILSRSRRENCLEFIRFPSTCGRLPREMFRNRLDLRVGIALGELMHDRRRALAIAESSHLLDDIGLGLTGQARHRSLGVTRRAVAIGAVGREVGGIRRNRRTSSLCKGRGGHQRPDEGCDPSCHFHCCLLKRKSPQSLEDSEGRLSGTWADGVNRRQGGGSAYRHALAACTRPVYSDSTGSPCSRRGASPLSDGGKSSFTLPWLSTSTSTRPPLTSLPNSSSSASARRIVSWMSRAMGRAPITGSKPFLARCARNASVKTMSTFFSCSWSSSCMRNLSTTRRT